MEQEQRSVRVWDVPTRVFHWALAVCICVAVITGLKGGGAMEWHGRAGLAVIGLVCFRIVWGVAGSTYARFGQFMPTPAKILAYVRGQWQGVGHNLLGALVGLHVLSIIFYALVKKHFLVPPMVTGKTRVPADSPAQDAQGGSVKALVVAVLIAAAAVYVAAGG